ncbi:signal peptidase II [Pontibacillus sp. ALD_SL1]|uniref:signal peptidase II n=1 Tax=Pontibacillus sp. ALD_SL1 TaxID=2777185 RepID=UPI001A9704BC|nr:signal peptidase II [Pontibacillus sp. ALD_SL1]QST01514.1 signal peptidase II [Pontibacillus sp. ALD_SL1]
MWYYVLAIVIILIDQLTKWIIDTQMKLLESIPVIEDVFYITSHRNKGAAWGMLEGQFWFFYIITVFVIAFVIYYIQKYTKDNPLLGISLGLILGGAVGNFIDRIFRKEVVDFLDVYIGSYDFPIFNVADSALVVGVGLVFIATILDERKKGSTK